MSHSSRSRNFRASVACIALVTISVIDTPEIQACGPVSAFDYPPTLHGIIPSTGTVNVARDAGFLVIAKGAFDVKLLDESSQAEVPLVAHRWLSLVNGDEAYALYPEEALAPQRPYRIEASAAHNDDEEPSNHLVVSNFVTSDALLEPLVLSGELGFSLRASETPFADGCDSCGGRCAVTGIRSQLLADVTLPTVTGGQGLYSATLFFSDQTPLQLRPRSWGPVDDEYDRHDIIAAQAVSPETDVIVQQEIYQRDFAYAGCFTYVVWDPGGHSAQASGCLSILSPEEQRTLAGEASTAQWTTEGDQSADLPSVETNPNGCALAREGTGRDSGTRYWWSAVLLGSILARRRRARVARILSTRSGQG